MLKTICLITLLSVTFAVVMSQESVATTPFQCYSCNSVDDSSCAGDKNEKYTPSEGHKKTCENGESFCRKIIQNGNFIFYF